MASDAAEHVADPKVRALAAKMAKFQATEINEYVDYCNCLDNETPGDQRAGANSKTP
jgi:uncharacterized protein (DUF305 family)